jgi:hypothetical protein
MTPDEIAELAEDCLDFPEGEDPTGPIDLPLEEPEATP